MRSFNTPTKPNNKTLNNLGNSYQNAKRSTQLQFKAALLEAGERDGFDYWRSFRDVWQYSEQIGRIPFVIMVTASAYLGNTTIPTV